MKKRVCGIILIISIFMTFVPYIYAATVVDSGTCGDNATWSLNSSGTLTISGTGEIYDGYGENSEQPWYNLKDNIKSVVINYGITNIPFAAFRDFQNITSISLSNSIERIELGAFINCTKLSDVSIPDSCKYLANDAFARTKWYNNQPNGVVYCGNFLYTYKGTMPSNTSINVKNGTIGICGGFYNESNLVSVTFPNTLEYIDNRAFSYCTGLTSITLPKNLKNIGTEAFSNCQNLKNITLPDNVEYIGRLAFSDTAWYNNQSNGLVYLNNWLLTLKGDTIKQANTITVKNNTIGIAVNAFRDDEYYIYDELGDGAHASTINLPNSIKYINDDAFSKCRYLTKINIPDGVETLNCFSHCKSLASINIPDSVKTLGGFYDTALTNITIPPNVTEIMQSAFLSCTSLKELSIPVSVTKIDNGAFDGCTTLTDVYYSGTKEQWDNINIDTRYDSNAPLLNATIHFAKEITNKPVITSSQVTKTNNTYTFNVNVSDVTSDCELIVVLYKNGKVANVKTTTLTSNATNNKTLNLTATNADSAKIFIWDSLKNMIPLCNAVTKNL